MMGSNDGLQKGCIFDLLSNSRRRMILCFLRKKGPEMSLMDLAGAVAAVENDVDVESLTHKQQKRVYVSLYQTHLPKLADAGTIQHEKEEGTVRLTDRATEIDPYLSMTTSPTYPWHKHYLSLAALSSLALLSHLAGVPGVGTIPAVVLGGAVTLVFGASGITQFVMIRHMTEEPSLELCEDSF